MKKYVFLLISFLACHSVFSGIFLSPGQDGNNSLKHDVIRYVNLSSYGNYRLFKQICEAFSQNIDITLD